MLRMAETGQSGGHDLPTPTRTDPNSIRLTGQDQRRLEKTDKNWPKTLLTYPNSSSWPDAVDGNVTFKLASHSVSAKRHVHFRDCVSNVVFKPFAADIKRLKLMVSMLIRG